MIKTKKLFCRTVDSLKNTFNLLKVFRLGDIWTRLSFLIMGISNIVHKQFLKGSLFLFAEITFLFFLFSSGVQNLVGLFTLGSQTRGFVYDENLGIDVLTDGDNSMLMLLYGIASLLTVILFLGFYILNIKSASNIQNLKAKNKPIPTLKQEIATLMDRKFHITLLTVPIIGILIFNILPLIFMISIAFTNYDATHQPPGALFNWVGLSNFFQMFSMGSKLGRTFGPVLTWTLIWAVLATASNYILGIILALMIDKKGIRFKGMWRTVFVLTIAIPQFISLLLMRNMLNKFGPVNQLLLDLGLIKEALPFWEEANFARAMVLVVNLWVGIPHTMLTVSGILMNIPKDMYESAKIDGASSIITFFKITLPHILFVTMPYLILQFIGNINNFNVIYLLVGGNPSTSDYYYAGKTDLLITWLYKLTVDHKDYNVASTIGICVFILSSAFSLITYRKTSAYKREEDFA